MAEDYKGADRPGLANSSINIEKRSILSPERLLMVAILEDAVDSYRRYQETKWQRERDLWIEAQRWIFGLGEEEWIFSFSNCCRELELDPGAVRKQLIKEPPCSQDLVIQPQSSS